MNHNQKTALLISGIIVAVLVILFMVFGSFWGWQRGYFSMMGPSMMGGYSIMFLGPLFFIVIIGLIIWAAVQKPGAPNSAIHKADSPIDILKRRYAQGEIDKKEFDMKKKDLV